MDGYLEAVIPETFIVLGKRLLPFSIGHFNFLTRANCALITGGEPEIDDLILATLICSKTWNENLAFFAGDWPREVFKFGKQTTGRTRFRQFLRLPLRLVDWLEVQSLLRRYIVAGAKIPHVHGGTNEKSGVPFQETFISHFRKSNPTLSESEIMDFSFAKSWWRYFSDAELSGGGLRLDNADDQELRKLAEEP